MQARYLPVVRDVLMYENLNYCRGWGVSAVCGWGSAWQSVEPRPRINMTYNVAAYSLVSVKSSFVQVKNVEPTKQQRDFIPIVHRNMSCCKSFSASAAVGRCSGSNRKHAQSSGCT